MGRAGRAVLLFSGILLAATLAGCGGNHERPLIISEVLSDVAVDGDIAFDGATFTITPVTDSTSGGEVLVGLSPGVEFRGFLDFPLDVAGGVPPGANVQLAFVELNVSRVNQATVPITMDLVSFPPPLAAEDFSRPLLATRDFDIFSSDLDQFVQVDVTPLVRQAIALGLRNVQFRFLLNPSAVSGQIGIRDIPGEAGKSTAPLLHVEYF